MSSNTFTRAIKGLWEKNDKETQGQSLPGYNIQGQIDDVFLVLALLGEALLPLEIFDDSNYENTLSEVRFAFANAGHVVVEDIFDKMSAELKYLCVAALSVCAAFSPLPLYRGFGASVHSDWDWACPDSEHLETKAKKSTAMFSKTPNPQPNRPVLLAFDRAIQLLQIKSLAFLSRRPSIASLSEQQPRYSARSRNDLSGALHTCRDWKRYIHKNGHPSPPGMTVTAWSMPWAGYTSNFSCEMTRDFEQVLTCQMDAGRLLHAFLCRDMLNLQEGQLLALPSQSPAEVLACWLAGRPGMPHKIVNWEQMDTSKEGRLRLLDKKVSRKMGRYPLPSRFVVRDPKASKLPRPPLRAIPSISSSVISDLKVSSTPSVHPVHSNEVVTELGEPEPAELDPACSTDRQDKQSAQVIKSSPSTQSAFVTKPDEMPLSVAALERDLPPLPPIDDKSDAQPERSTNLNHVAANLHDASAIPSPLRLRNPRSFAAELPAEPVQAIVTRSATSASTIASSEGTISSFSPVSPLTPILAENIGYVAMPPPGLVAATKDSATDGGAAREAQSMAMGTEEEHSDFLDYARAASG